MRALLLQALLLLATFAVVSAIALAAGAKNLGTALTFGQVAFGILLAALLLRPTTRGTDGSAD